MTFYEWIQGDDQEGYERKVLAAHLKELAKRHTEAKKIDSFYDLVTVSTYMTEPDALRAVTDSLWFEYCAATGHPLEERS